MALVGNATFLLLAAFDCHIRVHRLQFFSAEKEVADLPTRPGKEGAVDGDRDSMIGEEAAMVLNLP